jgi:hypothetical protein
MRGLVVAGVAALAVLGACDKPATDVTQAQPLAGEKLQAYSRDITDKVKIGNDAGFVQYFCQNVFSGPCPADIGEKLKPYGFSGDTTSGVDLGYAFSMMAADQIDGTPDYVCDDPTFIRGAYRAIFGREPDDAGGRGNLAFIVDTGQRRTLARAMLQSPEFRTR